jgi:hypothetical protein
MAQSTASIAVRMLPPYLQRFAALALALLRLRFLRELGNRLAQIQHGHNAVVAPHGHNAGLLRHASQPIDCGTMRHRSAVEPARLWRGSIIIRLLLFTHLVVGRFGHLRM